MKGVKVALAAQVKTKEPGSLYCPNTNQPCFCTSQCELDYAGAPKLVAIDPGPHLGFAFLKGENLHLSGMLNYTYENLEYLLDLILSFEPDEIVIEDFQLFPWKATAQSWSKMETPRIIGSLEYWAYKHEIPVVYQPPSSKQAFPDARLKKMGVYVSNDHARDAVRHGLYRIRNKEGHHA